MAVNEVAGDAQHAAQCGEVEVAVELVNGLAVLMTKLTVRCPEAAHTTCDRETQAKAFCTVHFLVPVAPVDLTFRFFQGLPNDLPGMYIF